MLANAVQFGTLHDNQWGSRPGRYALAAVLLKVLSYDIARTTRTTFGSFDNDAASCYDRIIIAMAMLLCRRQGMPSEVCLMAALCLLQANYYIKTKYGVSDASYGSTPAHPIHGPGQGSRMGPVLWLLISCIIFAAMEEICHGASFCDPAQTIDHQRTGDGFVDDVTNVSNMGLAASL